MMASYARLLQDVESQDAERGPPGNETSWTLALMKRVGVKPNDVNRSLPYEYVMPFHWHQTAASALTFADAWANARAERVKDKESVQKARGMMKMGSAIFSRSDLRS